MREGGKTRSRCSQSFKRSGIRLILFSFSFFAFFGKYWFLFCGTDRIFIKMCDVWQHGIDDLLFTVEKKSFWLKWAKNWQHGVSMIFAETAALKLPTRNQYDVLGRERFNAVIAHVSYLRVSF